MREVRDTEGSMSTERVTGKRSAWERARELAERTPEARNRYADFLRALSILAVVSGHWLIAAQVVPIFFMVGGYSNAASWSAALRKQQSFSDWLTARLQRLIGPVLPLVAVWAALGIAAHFGGLSPETIRLGSQAALVPIWFLAVYVLVAVFVPVAYSAWTRFGMLSFWVLAILAVAIDVARFSAGMLGLAWLNYLFVWLAVHQLGFAWRDGRLGSDARTLLWAVGGFAVLVGLVTRGPYPLSMVGVPGEEISNTLPPSIAMLALAALQGGLLVSLEKPARRWLSGIGPWTATVLVNGMIMSVYLWHLTAMVLVVATSWALGGVGLADSPGSGVWWATRPLWMALLAGVLFPFLVVFGRFERAWTNSGSSCPGWRLVLGATVACAGLAMLALGGVGGDGALGIRYWVALPFVGAALLRTRRTTG
jgi:hypothetical protein